MNIIIPITAILLFFILIIYRTLSKPKPVTFESFNKVYCIRSRKEIKISKDMMLIPKEASYRRTKG